MKTTQSRLKLYGAAPNTIQKDIRRLKMENNTQPENTESRELHQSQLPPEANKFHKGAKDGKHYWLTPPDIFAKLKARFGFDFDPCPYPKPEDFDGLTAEWGESSYVNPPFGSIMHEGKKKGTTAWVRKAIEEHKKGKRVILVHPIDKWVLMLIAAGAKIENLGDVRWCATEDGSVGKGTGRHIAMFILDQPRAEQKPSAAVDELAAFEKHYGPGTWEKPLYGRFKIPFLVGFQAALASVKGE